MVRIPFGGLLPLVALAGCASSNPFAALSRDRSANTPPPLFAESGGKSASKSGTSRGPFGVNLKESSEVAQSIQQGENAESEGRLEEARGLYERALTFDPDNSRAHHRLATIHDRREDFTQARRHYQAALKKTPKNPDVLSDLGYSCQLQGRDEESETHLREALKHDAKHRQALFNLGNLYARHGRNEDALSLYRRAGNEEEAQAALAQANSGSIGVRTASHRPTEAQIVQTESTSAPAAEKKKYPNAATRKLAEEYERRKQAQAVQDRARQAAAESRRPDPMAEAERHYQEDAHYAQMQDMLNRIDRQERPGVQVRPPARPANREVYPAGAEQYGPPNREQWQGRDPSTGREQWADMTTPTASPATGWQDQPGGQAPGANGWGQGQPGQVQPAYGQQGYDQPNYGQPPYGAPGSAPAGTWSNGAAYEGQGQPPRESNVRTADGSWPQGAAPQGAGFQGAGPVGPGVPSAAERAARMGLNAGAGGLSFDDGDLASPNGGVGAGEVSPGTNPGGNVPGWSRAPGWGNAPPNGSPAPAATERGAGPQGWSRRPAPPEWNGAATAAPAPAPGGNPNGVAPAGWSTGATTFEPNSDPQDELHRLEDEARRLQQRQAELRERMRQAPPPAAGPTVDIRPGPPRQ